MGVGFFLNVIVNDQRTALFYVVKYRIQPKAQGVHFAKAWLNQLVLQNRRDKISRTDDSLSSGKMSSRQKNA